MNLGQRLKEARLAAGMKQEELAKHLGVSRQTVSNWENERSAPDIGSVVKLGKLYNTSLDTLLSGEEVIRHFEDVAAKRRKFWQKMLEIGVILELLSNLIRGQGFSGAAFALALAGEAVLTVALVMHLRVFDHARSDVIGGGLGLAMHLVVNGIGLLGLWPEKDWVILVIGFAQLTAALLIWASGVWTVDWKSTRLWLIVVLLMGTPLLNAAKLHQEQAEPGEKYFLGGDYRVAEVIYPEDGAQYKNAFVTLYAGESPGLAIKPDGLDGEYIGSFSYEKPAGEETGEDVWLLTPEEAPEEEYRLVQEEDEDLCLSLTQDGQLQWKWRLTRDVYYGMLINRKPLGSSTIISSIEWYPLDAPMPEPSYSRSSPSVGWYSNITLQLPHTGEVTMYEDYYHAGEVESRTYTLTPDWRGRYKIKLTNRYDSKGDQCGIYRIPYEEGEFRFVLSYGP